MKYELTKFLFARGKAPLVIVPASIGDVAKAAGIGMSKHRPTGTVSKPKYNAAALALDALITNPNTINMLESTDFIYGEMDVGSGNIVRFKTDGESVTFEGERIHGPSKIIPLVLFQLRSASANTEMKEVFLKIKSEYLVSETAEAKDVLLFCDNFYFNYAKAQKEVDFEENDASLLTTVERSIETGLLTTSPLLDGLTLLPISGVKMKAAKKERKKKKTEDILTKAKNNEYIIPHTWSQQAQEKINLNHTLDFFISSEDFEDALLYLYGGLKEIKMRIDAGLDSSDAIGDDFNNVTLFGDPSGGKTTMAEALGHALGLPVYTISQSKYSEEDTYWGKTTAVEGGFKNVPTQFLEAFTNGGIAVLEEVNLVDPGVTMGALGNAIWSPGILMKDGITPVKRHPLCVIIGTKNIGTFGSRDVNEAFNNRFMQSYLIKEPTPERFVQLLALHDSNLERCKWVYDAYSRIKKYMLSPSVNAEDIMRNVSFRSCLGALKGMQRGQNPKRAIKNAIINKIGECDMELGHKLYTEVIASMPDGNF